MSATTALGWFASLLAVSMFLPQLVRTYRVGFDGSIGTIVLALCNGVAWVLYGVLRHDPVIVVCNVLLGSCALAILMRWDANLRRSAMVDEELESMIQLEDATR